MGIGGKNCQDVFDWNITQCLGNIIVLMVKDYQKLMEKKETVKSQRNNFYCHSILQS
jgi:hypothetical protein